MSARLPAMQILVSVGTVGASLQMGEILPHCGFFDCPVLSCPYLLFLDLRRRSSDYYEIWQADVK